MFILPIKEMMKIHTLSIVLKKTLKNGLKPIYCQISKLMEEL